MTSDRGDENPRRTKRKLSVWQETILLLGIALVLAIVIKAFFMQAFYIPSESMEPGLIKNDRILVQKVSYWGGNAPTRGDVVVFKDPGGWLGPSESAGPPNLLAKGMEKIGLYPAGGHLVKRVIGVEGDIIECCDQQGRLLVNGEPLDDKSFTKNDAECQGPMPGDCDWKVGPVPEGRLFVMGDHRDNSRDSSAHLSDGPFVPVDLVVGKVQTLVWPMSRFDWVGDHDTFDDIPDAG